MEKSSTDGFIDRSKVGILPRDNVEKKSSYQGNIESQKVSSDSDLFSVKTPGKTAITPRRIQRRRAALSLKDVRKEALRLNDKDSKIHAKTRSESSGSEKDHRRIPIHQKKKRVAIPEKYELLESFFKSLISLLELKRNSSTFTNISSQIEKLTDRRFTVNHLAQLKFIMPEAIVLEKIIQLDERTSWRKSELRIQLNFEAMEMKHSSAGAPKNLLLTKLFRSRLLEFIKSHPEGDEVPEGDLPEPFSKQNQSSILSTPETASTPKLSLATPALRPPRRCSMSSSPDDDSFRSPSKLSRRPPPIRHLRFDTPVKGEKHEEELDRTTTASCSSSSYDDVLGFLPDSLLQSIREKERIASDAEDPAISEAKRRKQTMAGLPKAFDMIGFLFQSEGRSVMNREKVIEEIISNPIDIIDRREAEEQLRLLQELAPEWIYEKIASATGDVLVCVNNIVSPEEVRSKLSGSV